MSYLLPNVSDLYKQINCNILMFDYRGYGESQGNPTEQGINMDADAALMYLIEQRNDLNPNNVILFGRDLGASVAIRLAARRQPLVCLFFFYDLYFIIK